jgi:3-phytase
MNRPTLLFLAVLSFTFSACESGKLAAVRPDALKPLVVTEATPHDTDDPAIWINPNDATKSLIIGTDKDTDGGLYAYDLSGRIIRKSQVLQRPNNVDIAYGLLIGGKKVDIAVTTERETNRIRIFSLPDLKPIDNGGLAVFEGEAERDPMGIALYTRPSDQAIFAIVGRKTGPTGSYLWQYRLSDGGGKVAAQVVRKFGTFSGKKEIEAIAVDNELGYIYYCDEQAGIKKYMADPDAGNQELAVFGLKDFTADNEGIAIYKKAEGKGYILVSNQQANTFVVYAREGSTGDPNKHVRLAEIPTSTIECDGADVTNVNLGNKFPNGMFVAMSNGMTFHLYDWNKLQALIDQGAKPGNQQAR